MINNYVILYSGGKMPESDLEQKQVLKSWEDWYGKVGKPWWTPANHLLLNLEASPATGK